jgi:hypothetical protein
MLVATGAVVLLGVLVMFIIAGNRFEDRVNDVDRRVDQSLKQIRTDVRKELDARLPQEGATTPTPTPLATPTPTPVPTETPAETATPDDGTGETPTPTPTIGP